MILKETKTEFQPAPEGLHQAVCVDVIDLGEQDTPWGPKPKLEIRWQIDALMDKGEPFLVVKWYTASLHEKSTLRAHLESWRGRKFTDEELKGFDTENLIGANCQLQLIHKQGTKDKTRTFSNVQAIVPLGKHTPRMEADDYVRVKDRPTKDEADHPGVEDEVPF